MRVALLPVLLLALVACAHAQLDEFVLVVPEEADGEPVLGDCASAHITHSDDIVGAFGCYNINLNRVEVHMFTDTETDHGDELEVRRVITSKVDEGVTSAVWDVRISNDGAFIWFVSNATFDVDYPDTHAHSSRVYFFRVSDSHLQVGCGNVREDGGAATMGHLSTSDDGHRAVFHMTTRSIYGPLLACFITSVNDINQPVLQFTTVPFTVKEGVYEGNHVGAWHPSISGDGSHVVFVADVDLTQQLQNNTSLFAYPWMVDINDLGSQDFTFHLLFPALNNPPASAGCSFPDTDLNGDFSVFMCAWNTENERPIDFPILYLYENAQVRQLVETGPWPDNSVPYALTQPHMSNTNSLEDIVLSVNLQSAPVAGTIPLEMAYIASVDDQSQFDYVATVCGARMFDYWYNFQKEVAVFTTNRDLSIQEEYATSADVNVWLWFNDGQPLVCPATHAIMHHPSKARVAVAVVFSTIVAFALTATAFASRSKLQAMV